MQPSGRDVLIVALSSAAAGLDAWSFFGLGHVFVANMTGNTVLLGFSIFAGKRAQVTASAISLACYFAGVFFGSLLTQPIRRQLAAREAPSEEIRSWPRRATLILALECLLVAAAGIVSILVAPAESSPLALLLIAGVALAVGLQSATINSLKLPGVATTYITGTWTLLSSGLAQLANGEKQGEQRAAWVDRLHLESLVLLGYFASALISGLVYHAAGRTALGVYSASVLVLVVGGVAFSRTRRPAEPQKPMQERP